MNDQNIMFAIALASGLYNSLYYCTSCDSDLFSTGSTSIVSWAGCIVSAALLMDTARGLM